jgi:hypothetical protein
MTNFAPENAAHSDATQKTHEKPDEGEHRLSHHLGGLLTRIVMEPCWHTAQDHSGAAIGASKQRQMNWRAKQHWYGVKPSQLDWRLIQLPLYTEFELKYGNGKPTPGQETTMRLLRERGIPTGCFWSLRTVVEFIQRVGFRLHGNTMNILREVEENYAAAERAAETPKKKTARAPRKAEPRYQLTRGFVSRARSKGIRI